MLRDWLDPAVLDEHDPRRRDRALDMFHPGNGPPYAPEWLAQYRDAQLDRMRRITEWCRKELAEGDGKAASRDAAFVVHGTVADPGFLDLTIAPNDRVVGTYWGTAADANVSPAGPARFCTLRSWLSNWSVDTTNGDARAHLPSVTVPILLVNGTADQGIRASHTDALWDAVVSEPRQRVDIKGGDHYFTDGAARAEALEVVADWLTAQGLT